ncbi:major facilitator superfamily domain-containing protein [Lasiosphaeris hirsuta]|uniref:Major facilitator superfamily domain-containing protein n=1 Tax=Lasiosphaeris hirsuta TaxID=260670 RepID=A0AA40A1Q4_9PEZI|nr:major facilitator superfamily domain-containing protein [Lasiosphaeris hirsuta]
MGPREGRLPSASPLQGSASDPSARSRTTQRGQEPKDKVPVGWLDLPNKDQLFVLSSIDSDLNLAAQVSAYSGLLVASFPLAQSFVPLPWGLLSDSHGRKFSIVIGLAISAVANAAFGFGRSFGALFFWRTLAGLANGNVSIMRAMTAEVVQERKYQTKAFLLLPLVFNSGMVASLAFGGFLAEPVLNLPWLFGPQGLMNWAGNSQGVQWLLDYPYVLPAMLNAAVLVVAFLLAVFWLRETLPFQEDERDIGVMGEAVVRWIKQILIGNRAVSYIPLNDAEDFLFDAIQQTGQEQSAVELAEVKESEQAINVAERNSLTSRIYSPGESILSIDTQPPHHCCVGFFRLTAPA